MKISINSKFQDNVQGGGMKFAKDLRDYFISQGAAVVNNLRDKDIDLIVNIVPFPFLMRFPAYSFLDAYVYKLRHPQTVIVLGIHENDERKGSRHMNKLLIKAGKYADALTFVAGWLKPLLEKQGLDTDKPNKIILHGGNTKFFNTTGKQFWDGQRRMRIVTHHWGGNYSKGHDFYLRLDELLTNPEFGDKFEFTFIGNLPPGVVYKNTKILKINDAAELGEELKKHDVYLTASRNEPAGMHHIEGALCGLPVLYLDSGALKEYNEGYGLEFNTDNFEAKLLEMYNNFDLYRQKILQYDRTAERMAAEHWVFYSQLFRDRDKFALKRSWLKIFWFSLYAKFYHLLWFFKRNFL
ncbi:MAG TPA: hypothetical protein VMD74_04190 [Candidatus Methylomirabilis sp.]|nr:hypothetical protein [Candidatus Methylomirabilis sp.]